MTRKYILLIALSLVGTISALHLMGRQLWCSCNELSISSWDPWSKHNSQHFFDYYSFSHLLHGVLFYALLHLLLKTRPFNLRFSLAILIECGWELLENSPLIIDRYRSVTSAVGYYGDSILNSVGDLASCAFGFWLASKLPWRITLLVALLVEILMLLS